MASVKFLMLLGVLCTCSGLGHGGRVTTQEPVTIDVPKRPVESLAPVANEAPVPKLVGNEVVTPELKTTTSTTLPTTTTPTTTPPTTTPPTTTPPTTTPPTTTPPTTTSTTTPPPTPPKPTPLEVGTWAYTDKQSNITCVVVQFAAQLNISYFQGNSSVESHAIFNFPATANATNGSCDASEQWIELSWPAADGASNVTTNKVVLVFSANATNHNYEMRAVNITLSPNMLVNVSTTDAIELWHGKGWQLPMATSYRCTPPTYLKMTSGDNTSIGAVVTVTSLQEEAFRKTSARGFSAARECNGGDVPDAVPIAVGCALAGLVVVVVVAYLVARRRSAVRGYLSM